MNEAQRVAYRALAAYRIPAGDREAMAKKIVAALGDVPDEDLPHLIANGSSSIVAHDIGRTIVQGHVKTGRQADAAGAAIVAVAEYWASLP